MKIYFVRHGDKARGGYFNPVLGHQDEPLTEEGFVKARALAELFASRNLGAVYASGYLRAEQTARVVADKCGLSVVQDARLNEIDNGVVETLGDEETARQYPAFWADFHARASDVRFPGGETGEEVKARQAAFLESLVEGGRDALAVCHEGYIRLLACHVLGMPVYRRYLFRVDFCGILELEYDGAAGWKLIRMNQSVL